MTRERELKIIKKCINDCSGNVTQIFRSRNILGDPMANLYTGEYFTLDICNEWSYLEIFGTTEDEWKDILAYCKGLGIES